MPATAQTPATLLPLTAQTTEGPFYFDAGKVRQDITEGQPGVPVEVRFTVVDVHGRPLAGRRVDLWHCNASGVYSGYASWTNRAGRFDRVIITTCRPEQQRERLMGRGYSAADADVREHRGIG